MKYLLFQFPAINNVFCAFQMPCPQKNAPLYGNISLIAEDAIDNACKNRQELFNALKTYGLKEWRECRQIHKDSVLKTDSPADIFEHPANLAEADGIMTGKKGLGLMIKTADCQPVFIADDKGAHIMALHVGWRGNRLNFILKAINEFCAKYSLLPENLFAVRGPSLGPASAQFINFKDEWGRGYKKWYNTNTKCMNLWRLTKDQLKQSGIAKKNIFGMDICTYLNSSSFFSYRKNKTAGRQANLVWIG